jgi:hypothetical protein
MLSHHNELWLIWGYWELHLETREEVSLRSTLSDLFVEHLFSM